MDKRYKCMVRSVGREESHNYFKYILKRYGGTLNDISRYREEYLGS